jgi:hypothetical protein
MRNLLGNCPPLGDPRVNGAATGRAVAFAPVRWDCGERGQGWSGSIYFPLEYSSLALRDAKMASPWQSRSGTGPGTSLLMEDLARLSRSQENHFGC